MKAVLVTSTIILTVASMLFAQDSDHLSQNEIDAAVKAKPDTGFVFIEDAGFTTPSNCQAQMPSESVFTPTGWLNALMLNDRKQYLPFQPTPDDTLRALTIISRGCANGTTAGPVCDSITRAAILSDKTGKVVVEAIASYPRKESWQNGFGASAACSSLVSKFSLADIQRARNEKGEFLIVTFDGPQLLKIYEVKEKHLKKLGI